MTEVLVEVDDLKVHFPIKTGVMRRVTGHIKAVDGISLDLREGQKCDEQRDNTAA